MKTVISVCLAVFCLVFMPPDGVCGARIPVDGVLRVNAKNPRYFTDVWRIEGGISREFFAPYEGLSVLYIHR